ncbi:MAG: hypothetical protein GY721_04480 [Deltaproteobacteria bacterium]|nr:hypothetical protein [Deltaproteobacteria bacterium]
MNEDMRFASSGGTEELKHLLHTPDMAVLSAVLLNRNLTEELAVIIAKRKSISSDLLDTLSHDRRWKTSYPLKLALCKNPRTPMKSALTLLKELRIFDLADLSRNHFIPVTIRKKAEGAIAEKLPTLPLGIKKNLARRIAGELLLKLLQEEDSELLTNCLNSPSLTEGDLFKAINSPHVKPYLIELSLSHPKWSYRYDLRFTLIRNNLTPLAHITDILPDIKTNDLKLLYKDPKVPKSTKPFIHSELYSRREK